MLLYADCETLLSNIHRKPLHSFVVVSGCLPSSMPLIVHLVALVKVSVAGDQENEVDRAGISLKTALKKCTC